MILDLEEVKNYLRVDFDEDDDLINKILSSSEQLVQDVSRLDDTEMLDNVEKVKVAVLFSCAYLYEHRENADHHSLMLSLRSLLFGVREVKF